MLKVKHIYELNAYGVDVHFKEKPHPSGKKGSYIESKWKVLAYLPAIHSYEDLYKTIIHEFIHARNDIIFELHHESEAKVERETIDTFLRSPEVCDVITDLYHNKFEMIDRNLMAQNRCRLR